MKYSQEYYAYVNALREFERAHAAWMNTSNFTPEGNAAKQYKNSCMAKYIEARKTWCREKQAEDLAFK